MAIASWMSPRSRSGLALDMTDPSTLQLAMLWPEPEKGGRGKSRQTLKKL